MPENYQFSLLLIETIFNSIGFLLGIVLMFRAHDNQMMLIWGAFTTLLMGTSLSANIDWLTDWNAERVISSFELLQPDRIFRGFMTLSTISIFPILSLRPTWFTWTKILVMCIPLFSSALIFSSFIWASAEITELHTTQQIIQSLNLPNVQMRFLILCLAVIPPAFYLFIPFLDHPITLRRKISTGMYFHISASILTMILLFCFSVTNSKLVFYSFGYALSIQPIVLSIIYFFNDNPLSQLRSDKEIEEQKVEEQEAPKVIDPVVVQAYQKMEDRMKQTNHYTRAGYSTREFADELSISQNLIIKALRYRGFSGYSEYINYLRLEHFKDLARQNPAMSIKEMMFLSGFTSRSSFYRRFAQHENMSPKEYIEDQLRIKS